jgi:hypothetical protein
MRIFGSPTPHLPPLNALLTSTDGGIANYRVSVILRSGWQHEHEKTWVAIGMFFWKNHNQSLMNWRVEFEWNGVRARQHFQTVSCWERSCKAARHSLAFLKASQHWWAHYCTLIYTLWHSIRSQVKSLTAGQSTLRTTWMRANEWVRKNTLTL